MEKSWKKKNIECQNFWKSHIKQWSETSISQKEYCRQHGLIAHRFTYWKTKLKRQHLPVKFVQVAPAVHVPISLSGLKLNVAPGLQIEIPDGFSRTTLEQVLVTLKVL